MEPGSRQLTRPLAMIWTTDCAIPRLNETGGRLEIRVSGRKWLNLEPNAFDNRVPGSTRMTTDSTQPQSELEPSSAAGPGQSQGHRRRRRRRKNKTNQPITAQAPQPQALDAVPAAPVAQQPPATQAPAQRPAQSRAPRQASNRQGAQQNAQQGPPKNQGRKKKVFQKSSAPAAQPGNNASAPAQGRRKSSGGGGNSRYEPKPSWQVDVANTGPRRSVPDISCDGDPNTGICVYAPVNSRGSGWMVVGGTSAATACMAGMANLSGSMPSPVTAEIA